MSLSLLLISHTLHFHEFGGGANLAPKLFSIGFPSGVEAANKPALVELSLSATLVVAGSLEPKMLLTELGLSLILSLIDPPNFMSVVLFPKLNPEVVDKVEGSVSDPKLKAGLSDFEAAEIFPASAVEEAGNKNDDFAEPDPN